MNGESIEMYFEIKPYNIDAAGHVNNAVFINWLEDLRVKLFGNIIPLNKIINKGCHLVVASTAIEYKIPLYLFDKPVGKIRIEKFTKGIWYITADIENSRQSKTEMRSY
jgi:acyl-CoA thioester hydrolase